MSACDLREISCSLMFRWTSFFLLRYWDRKRHTNANLAALGINPAGSLQYREDHPHNYSSRGGNYHGGPQYNGSNTYGGKGSKDHSSGGGGTQYNNHHGANFSMKGPEKGENFKGEKGPGGFYEKGGSSSGGNSTMKGGPAHQYANYPPPGTNMKGSNNYNSYNEKGRSGSLNWRDNQQSHEDYDSSNHNWQQNAQNTNSANGPNYWNNEFNSGTPPTNNKGSSSNYTPEGQVLHKNASHQSNASSNEMNMYGGKGGSDKNGKYPMNKGGADSKYMSQDSFQTASSSQNDHSWSLKSTKGGRVAPPGLAKQQTASTHFQDDQWNPTTSEELSMTRSNNFSASNRGGNMRQGAQNGRGNSWEQNHYDNSYEDNYNSYQGGAHNYPPHKGAHSNQQAAYAKDRRPETNNYTSERSYSENKKNHLSLNSDDISRAAAAAVNKLLSSVGTNTSNASGHQGSTKDDQLFSAHEQDKYISALYKSLNDEPLSAAERKIVGDFHKKLQEIGTTLNLSAALNLPKDVNDSTSQRGERGNAPNGYNNHETHNVNPKAADTNNGYNSSKADTHGYNSSSNANNGYNSGYYDNHGRYVTNDKHTQHVHEYAAGTSKKGAKHQIYYGGVSAADVNDGWGPNYNHDKDGWGNHSKNTANKNGVVYQQPSSATNSHWGQHQSSTATSTSAPGVGMNNITSATKSPVDRKTLEEAFLRVIETEFSWIDHRHLSYMLNDLMTSAPSPEAQRRIFLG